MSEGKDPLNDDNLEGVDMGLMPDGANDDLDGLDDVWGAGQEQVAKGEPLGTFRVQIEKATVGRSNSSGRLQIHYELTVCGEHESAGITLHKYDGLGTPQQASITQRQLAALGVNTGQVNGKQLPGVLLALQGSVVEVMARKNGDFYNIYFQKVINTEADGIAADAGEPPF
jgi:hypothetical protein